MTKKNLGSSVEKVWRIGDWFERETYDMFGIPTKA
ncbi:MAG: hypothetical protein Ct9H300mP18_13790 [Candidatus Neomarinimicrobiota bacterium]|nr:MAG: hypothetical protein Ct9H300mP18_13790 [Candidatus Neomarinimicrobiota bacterium]